MVVLDCIYECIVLEVLVVSLCVELCWLFGLIGDGIYVEVICVCMGCSYISECIVELLIELEVL